MERRDIKQVICLVGPTGSGKSGLALQLARNLNGAVINIDSRQVYSGLALITAQPSRAERGLIPHLLYGFLPLSRKTTAGLYSRLALEAIDLCFRCGFQPILVGGTGLYLDALVNGIAPIPPISRNVHEYWQMRLQRAGIRRLHTELAQVDAEYAAKISNNDPQRVTRALEVWIGTGRTLSWWHRRPVFRIPYPVLKLGVRTPLSGLTDALAERIEAMLAQGALTEVKTALQAADNGNMPGFSSIGFQELAGYLRGDMSIEACKEQWLAATRAYAKRQLTWFKRDQDIRWLERSPGDSLTDLTERAFQYLALSGVRT